MAILAIFDVPGMTSAQYDQIITDLEEPDGRISHVSAPKEGGWIVIDVWESEEHLTKFSERLIPVIQAAGATRKASGLLHNYIFKSWFWGGRFVID